MTELQVFMEFMIITLIIAQRTSISQKTPEVSWNNEVCLQFSFLMTQLCLACFRITSKSQPEQWVQSSLWCHRNVWSLYGDKHQNLMTLWHSMITPKYLNKCWTMFHLTIMEWHKEKLWQYKICVVQPSKHTNDIVNDIVNDIFNDQPNNRLLQGPIT